MLNFIETTGRIASLEGLIETYDQTPGKWLLAKFEVDDCKCKVWRRKSYHFSGMPTSVSSSYVEKLNMLTTTHFIQVVCGAHSSIVRMEIARLSNIPINIPNVRGDLSKEQYEKILEEYHRWIECTAYGQVKYLKGV
jgi:hypothetical protein